VRYAWVKKHCDSYDVNTMCRVLEVSRSGYYRHLHAEPSKTQRRESGNPGRNPGTQTDIGILGKIRQLRGMAKLPRQPKWVRVPGFLAVRGIQLAFVAFGVRAVIGIKDCGSATWRLGLQGGLSSDWTNCLVPNTALTPFPFWEGLEIWWESDAPAVMGQVALEATHIGLDIVGLVPVWGIAADLLNAGIYLAEGRLPEAGFSAFAAIPGLGYMAAGGQVAKYSYKAARVADIGINLVESGYYGYQGYQNDSKLRPGSN